MKCPNFVTHFFFPGEQSFLSSPDHAINGTSVSHVERRTILSPRTPPNSSYTSRTKVKRVGDRRKNGLGAADPPPITIGFLCKSRGQLTPADSCHLQRNPIRPRGPPGPSADFKRTPRTFGSLSRGVEGVWGCSWALSTRDVRQAGTVFN